MPRVGTQVRRTVVFLMLIFLCIKVFLMKSCCFFRDKWSHAVFFFFFLRWSHAAASTDLRAGPVVVLDPKEAWAELAVSYWNSLGPVAGIGESLLCRRADLVRLLCLLGCWAEFGFMRAQFIQSLRPFLRGAGRPPEVSKHTSKWPRCFSKKRKKSKWPRSSSPKPKHPF